MKPGKNLVELGRELERQANSMRDFLSPANHILVATDRASKRSTVDLDQHGIFPVREPAHEQLSQHVQIPRAYYDRMRDEAPHLFDYSVNHWLSLDTSRRLVRTLDGQARAFLSDRYRPLDNYELSSVALPILEERGFKVVSAEITERRFYLKAVTPRIIGEVRPGDVVQAGVALSNSEIGFGTLRIDPFLYFLVCANGAYLEDARVKKYHVGRHAGDIDGAVEFFRDETRMADDLAFWMKVRDALAGALSQPYLDRQLERLRNAALEPIAIDPIQVVEVTGKKYRFADPEKHAVLKYFLQGHAGRSELTRYGLMQAITRASHDFEDYDRATEFERLGGKILELPRMQWRALAEGRE